jgi:citrate lyase gamma subunit
MAGMSYNNISTNNNINTYTNTNLNNTNKTITTNSNDPLSMLGLGDMGLEGLLGQGEGADGTNNIAQILQAGILSKLFQGGEGGGEGFQMVLGALVKALNEKQQGTSIGIDSNKGFDGVHINDMVLRTLNGTTVDPVNTNKTDKERIDAAIKAAAQKHGVNEGLIGAIIKVESNFNPKSQSSAGAMGLMQLMPENVREYGITDPYNIEQNIDAGTRHIKDYLKMYKGDLEMALSAYNFGPGNMNRRGIKSHSDFYKLPTETKDYLVKIKKYYNA